MTDQPKLGERYEARDLPAGSVVSTTTRTEYVIGRSRCCMRWEQPIPGSETWSVRYEGRLPRGVWMTHRERAEVDEARRELRCRHCGARLAHREGHAGRYRFTNRLDGTDLLGSGCECPKNEQGHEPANPTGGAS